MLFLAMLAFNLLTMGLDLPRFSIVAVLFGILFLVFFLLWLGSYFQLDLMRPIHAVDLAHLRRGQPRLLRDGLRHADAGVHDHLTSRGGWTTGRSCPTRSCTTTARSATSSGIPTMNLKFDKEIPDVFEYVLLGAGRLVLHIPNVSKAIVMDNVLFINRKEEALKRRDEPPGGARHDRPGGREAVL